MITLIEEDRFITIVPRVQTFETFRIFAFRTSASDPFQPETVVATIFPSLEAGPFAITGLPQLQISVPPTTTTTTTTTTQPPASADEGADDEAVAAPPVSTTTEGGNSTWPWLAVGGAGIIALGGGAFLRFGRGGPAVAMGPGAGGGGGPVIVDSTPRAATTDGGQLVGQPPLTVTPASTGTGSDERDALGMILAGFAGIGSQPATTITPQQAQMAWDAAKLAWQYDQRTIVTGIHDTMTTFGSNWAAAMTALDTYRDRFSLLTSASTQIQGLLTQWEEEQKIRKQQDLAFAIATLVVGGFGLVRSGLAWGKRGVGFVRQASGRGIGAAQILVDEDILRLLAQELGKNFDDVMKACGNDIVEVTALLFRETFALRGWHYLSKLSSGVAMQKGMVTSAAVALRSADGLLDVSRVVTDAITHLRTAINATRRRARLTSTPWRGASAGGRAGPEAAKLAEELAVLRELAKADAKFLDSLRTAVQEVQVGEKGEDAIMATVRLLTDADWKLLKAAIEGGADLKQLAKLENLGQVGAAVLDAGQGAGTVAAALGGAATADELMDTFINAGTGEQGPALDITGYAQVYGMPTTFRGLMGWALWEGFTSPFMYWGALTSALEMGGVVNDLLEAHGDDFVDMANALNEAANALQQTANGLRLSVPLDRLERDIDGLRNAVDDLRSAADASPESDRAQRQEEAGAIAAEVEAKIAQLQSLKEQLGMAFEALTTMAEVLKDLAKGDRITVLDPGILARVNAARGLLISMFTTVQDASLPGGALPAGWGFSPQVEAAIRSWQEQQAATEGEGGEGAVPSPFDPPPRGSGSGPGWGPEGTAWEGMHWSDDGTQEWRDSLTDQQWEDFQDFQHDAEKAEIQAAVDAFANE